MENGNAADRSWESPCVSFSRNFFRGMLMKPTRIMLEVPYLLGHNCNSSTQKKEEKNSIGACKECGYVQPGILPKLPAL